MNVLLGAPHSRKCEGVRGDLKERENYRDLKEIK